MAQKLTTKCPEMVKIAIIMRYIYVFSYLKDSLGGPKNSDGSDEV